MSHSFKFCILGAHINNAESQLALLQSIEKFKVDNYNYDKRTEQIFTSNIQHGILSLYSINSALECLMLLLDNELNLGAKKNKFYFFNILDILVKEKIITNIKALEKCKELRRKRNLITHWEKNGYVELKCCGHIQFMMSSPTSQNKIQELLSILNKENLYEYNSSFKDVINDILENSEYHCNSINVFLHDELQMFCSGQLEVGY